MVLAIAIVVDDAIVVVEGVHAKLDQGYKSSREASIDAMSELVGAIVPHESSSLFHVLHHAVSRK